MQKKLPLSYIEISKKNLIHNIKQFRKLVSQKTKISLVVKGNAYGHGDIEVVSILNPYVDYFQVDSIEEFEKINKISKNPIFIFGYLNEEGIKKAIQKNAIISAFDFIHLLRINRIAKLLNKKASVHLPIDSYLGREGFMPNEIEKLLPEIKKMKNIVVDGIYSHFANIEDTMNFSHAEKQIKTYQNCVKIFDKNGFPKLSEGKNGIKTHISATSGILVYDKNKNMHDIVRLGIGVYGMWPSEHLKYLNKKKIILKPVLRWISHVAQVKNLPANYPIGYGLTFITKKKTKIAVIPQGYADGLSRVLSNNGEVLIKGKKCKILGRVAMNMIVVDVSNIKDIMAEDEVILLGDKITAEDLAKKTNTINYEVTTRISPLLSRVIV